MANMGGGTGQWKAFKKRVVLNVKFIFHLNEKSFLVVTAL